MYLLCNYVTVCLSNHITTDASPLIRTAEIIKDTSINRTPQALYALAHD